MPMYGNSDQEELWTDIAWRVREFGALQVVRWLLEMVQYIVSLLGE